MKETTTLQRRRRRLAVAAFLGLGFTLALQMESKAAETEFSPPVTDPDEFAKVFGTSVLRTKDTYGNDVTEIHTPIGIVKQEYRNGKLVSTITPPGLDYHELAKRPGAEVIRSRDQTGVDVVEFRQGGVVIRQRRQGATVISTELVTTGPNDIYHGTVYCLRLFLIVDLSSLNACYPASHEDLRKVLQKGLDETSKFIAENNLWPLTLEQSRFLTARVMRSYQDQLANASPEVIQTSCRSGEAGRTLRDLLSRTAAELQQGFESALRIPRPPLMCWGL